MDDSLSTRLVHAAEPRGIGAPSSPAIHTSTALESLGVPDSAIYGRHGNETWTALETALGELERGRSLVFASGMAACFALLMAATEDRSRLLVPDDGYWGFRELASMLRGRGIETVALDFADLAAVERELAPAPAVLWGESPTNPFLRVLDLRALAGAAQRHGARFVVDNTTATSALQRPLDLGALATVQSLTKSASGHSDVLLGAVTTRDARLHERVRAWRINAGAIAGPFEAWVALRGLRTLGLRIERQSSNALALARHLAEHPRVRAVHYPGLDPRTARLAREQMPRGGGPLLSFELEGGAADADAVVARARVIRPATSFGGVESSWERRARWRGELAPPSLIRLSAGIEELADLVADVDQALAAG
jgi:cystathionine gamma-synthase